MAMTTERLNEIKTEIMKRAESKFFNLDWSPELELVAEVERLRGLEENRQRVHDAAVQGARGMKEPEA